MTTLPARGRARVCGGRCFVPSDTALARSAASVVRSSRWAVTPLRGDTSGPPASARSYRTALRGDWCIDTETWRWLTGQLPPPQWIHGRPPQLGDRKRQSASVYIWARVTGTEHVFAPHPLRDQQPADQHNAWRLSDYSFWARLQQSCTRPHDIALRHVLDTYACGLAAHIDLTGNPDHRPWNTA